jgi:DNA-binding HxlR family transcriptional regulator
MLTQSLRRMERDGLLIRTVTPSVPVRTDYELMPDVDAARTAYDSRV